jgi:hypothetical protein
MYLHPHFFVNIQNIFDPPPIQFTQIFIVLDIQLKEKKNIYFYPPFPRQYKNR